MTNLYSVSYNVNNATSGTTPPTQMAESNSETYTFTAPTAEEYGLARTGYTFMGWAESPNAVFKEYEGGATVSLSNTNPTKTLYAVWAKPYTLQYSAGDGGGGGALPENETLMLGHLPYTYTPTGSQSNIFKVGHIANGWSEVTFTETSINLTTTPIWIASSPSTFNTMQDITTSGFCDALNETGRQLFDIRDGKKYWVAKLKDENCWMTQNLDYDDPDGIRRTGDAQPDAWPNDNNARQYWDPGEKITNGKTLTPANSNTDKRLLVGNYYSWVSATNGSGATITSTNTKDYPTNANDNICPDGWRLPLSGANNDISAGAASKSFGLLLHKYSIPADSDANLIKSPLYFVRSGNVSGGILYSTGSGGWYWSSTTNSATTAYNLGFGASNVNPSSGGNRCLGMPVRCVAK